MQTSNMHTPGLKLYYLDHPFWRAECVRLALYMGKIPFEDVRASRRELEATGKITFGTLPALEVEGKGVIAQTQAIAAYCGKLSGFYPADPFEGAKVDEALDGLTDATDLITDTMQERDPNRKIEWRRYMIGPQGRMTMFLSGLETMLEANGKGVFAGDAVSVADLGAWRFVGWLTGGIIDGIPRDYVSQMFPRLWQLHLYVGSLPQVQDWQAKHPGNYHH